jgi:hypothetical protein
MSERIRSRSTPLEASDPHPMIAGASDPNGKQPMGEFDRIFTTPSEAPTVSYLTDPTDAS